MGIDDNVRYLIIRMEEVTYIDQSGAYCLEDILQDLRKRNIKVFITGLDKQSKATLERLEIIPHSIEANCIYDNFTACINTEFTLLEPDYNSLADPTPK